MDEQISWGQTIAAAVVILVAYFLLLYVAAPIIEALLNLRGRLFVPERFGGGSEVDNPGVLTLAIRAIMASGLSAVAAFMVCFKLFSEAHRRTVAAVFALAIVAWAGLFVFAGLSSGDLLMPITMVALGAGPPLFVALWAWKGVL